MPLLAQAFVFQLMEEQFGNEQVRPYAKSFLEPLLPVFPFRRVPSWSFGRPYTRASPAEFALEFTFKWTRKGVQVLTFSAAARCSSCLVSLETLACSSSRL